MAKELLKDPLPEYGPFKGIDNRALQHSVPDDRLRNLVNCDVDNSGRVRSRKGYERVYDGTNTNSLYNCALGTFFWEDGSLKLLNSDRSATTLRTGLASPLCYEFADGKVFFSDGTLIGLIDENLEAHPWGISAPAAPSVVGVPGTLAAGAYIVFTVGVSATGEESSPSEPVAFSLSSEGGLAVSVGLVPGAASVDVYVTSANGEVGYKQASTVSGGIGYVYVYDSSGRERVPIYSTPMPGCSIIHYYRGRIYGAAGSVLWYSEPYAYGRVMRQTNFFQFPAEISIVISVPDGIYLVADRHYFMAGNDVTTFEAVRGWPYKAIKGTAVSIPNSRDVMWMSERGVVRASLGASIKNLQEDHVAVDLGTEGCAMFREQDGLRQYVATYTPTGYSTLASAEWVAAETTRRAEL
jgi:hypothetical protein